MIDVYLLETICDDQEFWGDNGECIFVSTLLNVRGTDIWIEDDVLGGLEVPGYTKLFWREVKKQQHHLLTYLGEL